MSDFLIPKSRSKEEASRFYFRWPNPQYDPDKPSTTEEETGEDRNPETLRLSVPLLKYLTVEAIEQFEQGYEVAGMIFAADTPEARAVIRSLDNEQLEVFMKAWRKASEVSVGESSASDKS